MKWENFLNKRLACIRSILSYKKIMDRYSLHRLKNGIKTVLIPNTSTSAVTVLVMVKVGSRMEDKQLNGASHFIEHLLFKGSKKRPKAIDLSIELEGVGADYNAFTSKEYTGYYIKLAADKLPLAVDILADMLINPLFKPYEIERERGVILEEINMIQDNPSRDVYDMYDHLLYQKHPLGSPIAGPKEVIKNISRADLLKHKKHFYNAANTVIAVAGKMQKTKTLQLLNQKFRTYDNSRQSVDIQQFEYRNSAPSVIVKRKQTEQIHMIMGFPALSDDDPRLPAAKLLSTILGTGMSSRLFIEAREKRGLCYSIFSILTTYEDTGDLLIKAGLDKKRLVPAVELIVKELKKIKSKGVTAAELKKAKEFIKGSTVLSLEDAETQAGWYAREIIFGEAVKTPTQKLKEINKVTAKDIQLLAKDLFTTDRINLALLGPLSSTEEKKIKHLLKL